MKKTVLMTFISVLALCLSAQSEEAATGATEPVKNPQEVVDKRQERQAERIQKGVENGTLSEAEQKKLQHQQGRIQKMEEKAQADGQVSKEEMKKLQRAQNNANRDIKRKNHNKRNK